ncbi:MAG: TraB/GumN family protein [Rhodobacteraceae bacterium]|nr:TraB/GumN family protein [Paracoccaceae bacterium]
MLRLAFTLFWLALAGTAVAGTAPGSCGGRDLLAAMTPAARAALVGNAPYPNGNFWRATRGATSIVVAGTYHLNDPRFDPIVAQLKPYLDQADTLLLEAGPDEEKQLKDDIAAHPDRIVNAAGPTLPEALSAQEWARLSEALRLRGMPPFMASKFQPWYVAMLLDLPPCPVTSASANGLDARLTTLAQARHIPIVALEPWDTTFHLFTGMSFKAQLGMLRMSLAGEASAADLGTTLTNAYFAGQHRLIWEFGRQNALSAPGADPAAFDQLERTLLTDRTLSWMPGLLAVSEGHSVVVAVGAAHLGGADGLLNQLHLDGFALHRLPF